VSERTLPQTVRAPWARGTAAERTANGTHGPLVVPNLQADLAALAPLLVREVSRGHWLDSYLLAAGMNQVVEDYLHGEMYPFNQAAEYLAGRSLPLGWMAGRVARGVAVAGWAIDERRPTTPRVVRWQRELATLVDALAALVRGGSVAAPMSHERVLEWCRVILGAIEGLPLDLRRSVIRLPACFRHFDQHPADLARVVREFSDRCPPRRRPLLMVGVRTSGSYLAPLCAAFLKAEGWERVHVLTTRPGRRLLKHERALVRDVARRDGLALITDDPPATGTSIARSARQLEALGLSSESIVLLLQVFGASPDLPTALDRYRAVVLPRPEWTINARLSPEAVKRDLSALLGSRVAVLAADPMALPPTRRARRHRRALFRVFLPDRRTGDRREQHVLVEGVGLGYLGRQALAATPAGDGVSPTLYGVTDGLLYREWLPDESRVGCVGADSEVSLSEAVAAYASERRRALPVAEDLSVRLAGLEPAWEVASAIVSHAFGRAWPLAKVLLVDRLVKRLLHVEQPSVVDGGTDIRYWFFPDRSTRSLIKVSPADGSFSNVGLSCFDAAFDLAGATARACRPSFPRRVRQAYAKLGNQRVDEERLLLYELAHLWGRQRKHAEEEAELQRARARVLQRYFAELYLRDVEVPVSGPLCALDVDGVLETEHLGFPSMTPAAARTLRALMLHGYRPLLVTGRSLDEVAERCRSYGLAGGVAEYGAASYVADGERVRELLPDGGAVVLGRLRSALTETKDVQLDRDYRLSVRAYRVDGRGARRGLLPHTIAASLERAGADQIRPIVGEGQTDFMVSGVDKGTGLRALVADLGLGDGARSARPFALAVGDTLSDAPCASLATLACAPAHAHAALCGAGFEMMTMPYQAGLAQAAAMLLGHPPGGCRICRPPPVTRERGLFLGLLAAQERGVRSMAVQAAKLAIGGA
jgi:hydroxymethylpyrimidine pyrophosphatase-like HAD family hydrolase